MGSLSIVQPPVAPSSAHRTSVIVATQQPSLIGGLYIVRAASYANQDTRFAVQPQIGFKDPNVCTPSTILCVFLLDV